MSTSRSGSGGKFAGGGDRRDGADRLGARVAEAAASGGDHSFPAKHRGCEADAGAAGCGDKVLRAALRAVRGCRRRDCGSASRRAGADSAVETVARAIGYDPTLGAKTGARRGWGTLVEKVQSLYK